MNPDRFLGSSRYRHPGDVIWLITGGLVLVGALAIAVFAVRGSWLADTLSAGPAILAGAAAVTVAGSAWLSQPWRRAAWSALFVAGVALLVVSAMPPTSLVIALAAGVTAGAGLLVAFGVLYPDQTVLMSFLFPIKAKYMVMIYAVIELLLTFGPNSGVSTIAHLGGMAFGYLYLKRRIPRLKALPDIRGAYKQWRLQRAKRKFQVYMRKHGGGGRGPWVN